MKHSTLKTAFRDTIPVMTGYLFLGFGFGIYLNQNGYGPLWALAMSLFIYAGSMQFVAVSLITGGASLLTTLLTTLMVNARHLFYGISMVDTYKNAGRKKPYLIFALTDETYALVSQSTQERDRHSYCFLVSLFDHIYWVTGSLLGSFAGEWLQFNYEGIDFVLTALFLTIFVEQWFTTNKHFPAITGVLATGICLVVFGKDIFLIPSMIMIALVLAFGTKEEKGAEHD